MNLSEAYKELELNEGASSKEVNAAFRKLSKKYHPDLNKDNHEAEIKFKKINEAKSVIENPPKQNNWFDWGVPRQPEKATLIKPRVNRAKPIVNINLTFLEAALGASKTIEYKRYERCTFCDGAGFAQLSDNCQSCKGLGYQNMQFGVGGMSFQKTCTICQGTGKQIKDCTHCDKSGTKLVDNKSTVQVPPGATPGRVNIADLGNFVGRIKEHKHDIFDSVIANVSVEKDPEMEIVGPNIHSNINISLLDSLKGTTKKVRTIKGDLTLKIRENTKHGTKISANGYGPGNLGSHIFNVNVDYPNDSKDLIEFLEKNNKE